MKIFLTGATGFIGTKLVKRLLSDNHEVTCYVRNIEKARKKLGNRVELLSTNVFQNHIIKTLEGCDVVVNLAGEPIVKRWTKKNKKRFTIVELILQKKYPTQ
tara:strand:+ start:792 stop:1097 length:306 start_codon:yes stop_codon:yes gene_type:complete